MSKVAHISVVINKCSECPYYTNKVIERCRVTNDPITNSNTILETCPLTDT